MEAKHSMEPHLRTLERDTAHALAPLGEAMTQSRVYFEKSLNAMRDETLDLMNRLHEHNGKMLSQFSGSHDIASLAAAQEKWFADYTRELYESSTRVHEATRHLLADGLEKMSARIRAEKPDAAAGSAANDVGATAHDAAAE